MPRKPINYSNACIYKIVCNDINITECYVGSTTKFSTRKNQHKNNCNNENNRSYDIYVYKFIRDHGGWSNWDMLEIEKYECKDGNELRTRERYYIEHLKAELNKQVPTRTDAEYYIDNKDKISERHRQNHQDNKEHVHERHRKNYQTNKDKINKKHNCECGGRYTTCHKALHQRSIKHQTYIQNLNTT
jgi:hypothetical protein